MNKIVIKWLPDKVDESWLGSYITIDSGETFIVTEVGDYRIAMRELNALERVRWYWLRFKIWIGRKSNA